MPMLADPAIIDFLGRNLTGLARQHFRPSNHSKGDAAWRRLEQAPAAAQKRFHELDECNRVLMGPICARTLTA